MKELVDSCPVGVVRAVFVVPTVILEMRTSEAVLCESVDGPMRLTGLFKLVASCDV